MDTSPIIIAGGGIAGLAAALALGSHDALILEQTPIFTTAGAGLQIGPNAVRALQKLGAWDAVQPHTTKPKEIQFRDGISGKLISRLPLGPAFAARYGADYHVAHRAGLHAGLLDVVRNKRNVQLELGQALHHVEVGTNDVQFLVKGQSRRSPALIATDGVQSQIRQMLFPGTPALSSGASFHRALVPLLTGSNLPLDCVTVWMVPGGHVVHYAISNPQQLNIVAICPKGSSPLTFFNQAARALIELIIHAVPHFTEWPALYVQPLSKWTVGNTLLLGDAAHGSLPYMAQGAAMALEDAVCLLQALTNAQSLRHVFAETESRRLARTKRLHFETLRTGSVYHASGLARLIRNFGLAQLPIPVLMKKLDWLYNN